MSSRSLRDCVPRLADGWIETMVEYTGRFTSRDLLITCTHRGPAEQFQLYQVGRYQCPDGSWARIEGERVLTNCDGTLVKSRHNAFPAEALDFAVLVGGKIVGVIEPGEQTTWAWAEYERVGEIAERHGLVWGGRWPQLKDGPHLELPKGG